MNQLKDWQSRQNNNIAYIILESKLVNDDIAGDELRKLTSIICKIMESIIKDYLMSYVCNNNIISSLQHGFFPGRSCQSNLLIMLNCLIERGIITDVIYLDFAKTFNPVPHNTLNL